VNILAKLGSNAPNGFGEEDWNVMFTDYEESKVMTITPSCHVSLKL
jgi:hypothetical protein